MRRVLSVKKRLKKDNGWRECRGKGEKGDGREGETKGEGKKEEGRYRRKMRWKGVKGKNTKEDLGKKARLYIRNVRRK